MNVAGIKQRSDIDRDEEPVLLVGIDQTVSYANPAAHKLLGYLQGTLGGLSLRWVTPPSRHGELRNIDALFTGQGTRRIRSSVLSADGKHIEVAMTLEPCKNESGETVAVSIRYQVLPAHTSMVVPRAALPRMTSTPPRSGSQPLSQRAPAAAPKVEPAKEESPTQPVRVRVPPHGARSMAPQPPPPPASQSHVNAPRGVRGEELNERLDSALQLIRWLDERFASANDPSLDDPRERARLRLVLSETRGLVQECRRELDDAFPSIPQAPKLPQLR
jgi:PAS domain S-box-containing protein